MINAINIWCHVFMLHLFIVSFFFKTHVYNDLSVHMICQQAEHSVRALLWSVVRIGLSALPFFTACVVYFSPLCNNGKYFLSVNCWSTSVLWNFWVNWKNFFRPHRFYFCSNVLWAGINPWICTVPRALEKRVLRSFSSCSNFNFCCFLWRSFWFYSRYKRHSFTEMMWIMGLQMFFNPHYHLKLINVHKKATIECKHISNSLNRKEK